ncbi:hypothetical protein ABH940_002503 [Streptacidiphilus sp. BW17]
MGHDGPGARQYAAGVVPVSRRHAPQSAIAFNTSGGDSMEAAARWLSRRGASGYDWPTASGSRRAGSDCCGVVAAARGEVRITSAATTMAPTTRPAPTRKASW